MNYISNVFYKNKVKKLNPFSKTRSLEGRICFYTRTQGKSGVQVIFCAFTRFVVPLMPTGTPAVRTTMSPGLMRRDS